MGECGTVFTLQLKGGVAGGDMSDLIECLGEIPDDIGGFLQAD
jgi:hypothetical protein